MIDFFDPVTLEHTGLCRSAAASLGLERVLLVLQDSVKGSVCAPRRDRWRMLVAACAGCKELVPVDMKNASVESLSRLYPGDELIPLDPPAVFSALCPSVQEYCDLLGLYGVTPVIPEVRSRVVKLFKALKPHRFAHSLSVARTARTLALRYGIDPQKAEEAGLFHDCAKCLPLSEMRKIAVKHRITEDPAFLESGALLHSVVGSYIAEKDYGITDREELDAIAYHNTGHAGMTLLAMCVCLADFIEPNRESFPLLEETRRLAETSLECALLHSLEATADYVLSGGKYLHPRTADTIAWLKTLPAVRNSSLND